MSKFFIKRPIVAIVFSLMVTIIGLLAMFNLPIAQYPSIAPPQIRVSTQYIGASAQVVADSVASVIEQQMVGVQNLDYMVSNSTSDGTYSLIVQLEQGADPDMGAINVQNSVARATSALPAEVQAVGVNTRKSSGDMAMVFSLISPNETYDQTFLKNYGTNYMVDSLKSVSGVGSVQEFGSDYAMRIWLNPPKMAQYGVTISDVTAALAGQNLQAAAGKLGTNPAPSDQQFQYAISVQGRISTPEEFGHIVVRKDDKGNLLHLSDIARIEMGSAHYGVIAERSGVPAAGFAISLTSDANALETISEVKRLLAEQAENFPEDITYDIVVDATAFVVESIQEVVQTFVEALLLVALIVYLFLQSWRATLIPMIAVPVSLLGTFAVFTVLGFSINTLTLFAMVLAIGLVVDDAIVVIEAVEYEMKYNKRTPREATVAAMENVSNPVIGIAFVLSAVFIPVSFMGGITGVLYKQFALTIAVSVMISALVALSLTPALCAMILQPPQGEAKEDVVYRGLTRFNRQFERMTEWYGRQLERLSNHLSYTIILLVALVGISAGVLKFMPTAFVPPEDNGYFMTAITLPEGASLSRTLEVTRKVSSFLDADSDVKSIMGVTGFDVLSGGAKSSGAVIFTLLNNWSERTGPGQDVNTKVGKTFAFGAGVPEGNIMALNPPPIPGLGSTGGFTMYLVNKSGESTEQMIARTNEFLAEARKQPAIGNIYTTFNNTTPSYDFEVNREKAAQDGVELRDIYRALQGFYGSMRVGDFLRYGKNFNVVVQADEQFRTSKDMNRYISVRNRKGEMVSVDNYIMPKQTGTAYILTRFDNYPAVKISGSERPGFSSGDVINALKDTAKQTLPSGYTYDWADQSREEIKAGSQTVLIFALGLIFVFLVLAALYESWKVPFAVLFSVPVGICGSLLIPFLLHVSNNIYLQIGLLTLVGLAAKNAILIIEYAKVRVDERGMGFVEAAVEAAKIRVRPIVMTSLAFIFGSLPLALSSGAGAAARHAMGVTVVAGMTMATVIGIFVIPMLFIIVEKIGHKQKS